MSAIKQIALTLYGQPVQGISIPIGSTVLWTLNLEDPVTRLPVDLTAVGTAVQMSFCSLDVSGNPVIPALFSHEATIPGSPTNECTITWTSGDTVPSGIPITPTNYGIDVWLIDGSGNRLQELGTATVSMTAVATLPGDPVTPSPPEQPLGLGPAGLPVTPYADFASFPTPAGLSNGTGAFAVDTQITYIVISDAWVIVGGGNSGVPVTFYTDESSRPAADTVPGQIAYSNNERSLAASLNNSWTILPQGSILNWQIIPIPTATKTGDYTASMWETVRCDPTSAGFTVTLPSAGDGPQGGIGNQIKIKNVSNSANTITVDGNGSQMIDGALTFSMSSARECITLESDGSSWMVV
jgi:hypothetical protein